MEKAINLIIKFILSLILVIWAFFPYISSSSNESILGEIFRIGLFNSIVIISAFFIMVAFYCQTLQRCLTLIKPESRKMKPKSVWYMFAIPFNFVEDF